MSSSAQSAGVRLRTLLALLIVAITVPLALFAGFLILSSGERQRAEVDLQNVQTARAISTAIDQSVDRTASVLDALAVHASLDVPDLPAFQEVCRRVIPRQSGWNSILLADTSGRLLLSSAAYFPLDPSMLNVDWTDAVLRTGRPTVSNLFTQEGLEGHFVIVAVPVVRRGVMSAVLGVQLRAEVFSDILRQQHLPPDGVVTLLDAERRIVARSRGEEVFRGAFPTPAFLEAVDRSAEGAWRDELLEGTEVYAAMSRSPQTGWTVGVGLPAAPIDGPIARSVWILVFVGLAAMGAGGAAALALGGGIVRSLSAVATAAVALARGASIVRAPSRIAEVNTLWSGLEHAARTIETERAERGRADIERRLAAEERERALHAEQAARGEAEEANRSKDEFLMTMSHELRTPLNAICGWARMLASREIAPGSEPRAIESIERNARALQHLVDDLLDVSRAISGKLRLEVRAIDMGAVVQAAVDAVQPAAAAKQLGLHVFADPDAQDLVGDPDRLQQVVWNLVSNAVRFTPSEGRIDVRLARHGDVVELSVTDSGPGIDLAIRPFLFERFTQAASSANRAHGGLGLGLAIVRHLVDLHGGQVTADDTNGAGATFRVRLPAPAPTIGPVHELEDAAPS